MDAVCKKNHYDVFIQETCNACPIKRLQKYVLHKEYKDQISKDRSSGFPNVQNKDDVITK